MTHEHDDTTHTHPEQSEDTAHHMPADEPERPARLSRARLLLKELPGALTLAALTAMVTLGLALLLSLVTGAENVAHREATRCHAALIVDMLQDAYEVNPEYEQIADDYPRVNTAEIDCAQYIEQPAIHIDPEEH